MSLIKEITIQYVGSEGQGVGTDPEGFIYFVPSAFPGDEVRIEGLENKRYRDARILDFIKPSLDRVETSCPYVGECGGCDWMELSYEKQVQFKSSTLKHVLKKADLEPQEFRSFVPSKKLLGYRRRIQVRQKGSNIGFYKKNTHTIVNIAECAVADPKLNQALSKLRLEKTNIAERKIELTLQENETVRIDENVEHSASGFCQIHPEQNQKLAELILAILKESQAQRVLELFCGDGNFTRFYNEIMEEVLGVDSNEHAIWGAKARNLNKVDFECAFIESTLARKLRRSARGDYDTLLLDPPRRGIGKCLLDFVTPEVINVVYVSCRPLSFVQDAQLLIKNGFQMRSIQGIDMFPHTHHIESLAWFSRL